jgi:hypothetical protein
MRSEFQNIEILKVESIYSISVLLWMSEVQGIYGSLFNIFSYFVSVMLLLNVLYMMTLPIAKIV